MTRRDSAHARCTHRSRGRPRKDKASSQDSFEREALVRGRGELTV
jgi:hypothetical protein